MRHLVCRPVVCGAVILYGAGIVEELGSAYGLPTDGLDHTPPVVLVAASTATGTVGGVGFVGGINAISGDDIEAAPPERWKVTKSI